MTEDKEKKLRATLRCVTKPDEAQTKQFIEFLKKQYDVPQAELEIVEDPSLGSGFILTTDRDEFNWSAQGRRQQFDRRVSEIRAEKGSDDSSESFMSLLKSAVAGFRPERVSTEVGTVASVGDGIAMITGLDHVMYGEVVVFDDGTKGMVQDLNEDGIGVILFDEEGTIGEGMHVRGTNRTAGLPVGDAYLGRTVNALGAPIDGLGDIPAQAYLPLERPAPGIVDRQPVTVPLQTGIMAIDSMFPIGRGQRELIIGDRQTGKTSIALDTILNQKGKDCICIYCGIGQKASTLAGLLRTLRVQGAMDYSVIVASTASDPAAMQYAAPYAATTLAEYFMEQGKDVLVIYDDLSKHAVAYRTISLLLGRSPGREAYPGDVFYLHSRLLERASRLSDAKGGGSITALPIIETQDGDLSAYIPTNVISITDGQIFLESDLFFEGQRPAVNVGLSVSRVGGAAQTGAMKKAAGSLRIDLAQFRELEVFTQFSSDLDETTKQQLQQGHVLMELLKQPLGQPMSMTDQVLTLYTAEHKKLIDVPVDQVKNYQSRMLAYFHKEAPQICRDIERSGSLNESLETQILAQADAFHAQYFGNTDLTEAGKQV